MYDIILLYAIYNVYFSRSSKESIVIPILIYGIHVHVYSDGDDVPSFPYFYARDRSFWTPLFHDRIPFECCVT